MTREDMDRLLEEHFQAETAGDIARTLATFTADVEHDVVVAADQPLRGHEAVAEFYAELFGHLDHDSIRSVRRWYGDDFAVDEAIVEARAVGAPFGLPGRDRPVRFRLLHVFEFREGRISRENAWLDLATIQQQLA